jgi:hypothetical protein
MDLHPGSSIWATSEGEGLGCQFNIDLPLILAERENPSDISCNNLTAVSKRNLAKSGENLVTTKSSSRLSNRSLTSSKYESSVENVSPLCILGMFHACIHLYI